MLTNLNLECEACSIELTTPMSVTEIVSQMRAFLEGIRSKFIEGEKSTSRLVLGDSGLSLSPYEGSDLIEQLGKQWFECSFSKEPKIFFSLRFLLDVTVIDNFLEASLPN